MKELILELNAIDYSLLSTSKTIIITIIIGLIILKYNRN